MNASAFCDVMTLLRKAPRDKNELSRITGLHPNTVHLYVKALLDEGHIRLEAERRMSTRGRPSFVYAWQESLHGQ
jgi:predicted ArsR family transcriptional regulator